MLVIEDIIKDSNKIFWIKAISKSDESPQQDNTNAITINGSVKNIDDLSDDGITKIDFTIHADIFRRIFRDFINEDQVIDKQMTQEYLDRIKKADSKC